MSDPLISSTQPVSPNGDSISELLVDEEHRIAFLAIPLNGTTFLKTAIEKQARIVTCDVYACQQVFDANWMRLLIVRDPVDRLYDAFVNECVISGRNSHLTFAKFAAPFIEGNDNENEQPEWCFDFASQSSFVSRQEDLFNWLIPFEIIPKLITVLEHRIGKLISPKKVTPIIRFGHFDDATTVRDRTAAELRQLDRIPDSKTIADEKLTAAIREAFDDDWKLYERAISTVASIANSSFEDRAMESDAELQILGNLRQISSKTSYDRYPKIFQAVAGRFKEKATDGESLNLASFGCSSGEECYSLRKYFPSATIHGFDLRERNLKLANERNTDRNIHFHFSTPENLATSGPFDAIFAMSVFCRWPDAFHRDDCDDLYSFDEFSRDVESLDRQLNPGGLLVIYNAMFRFTDLEIARRYAAIDVQEQGESGFVTKFSPQNLRLERQDYPFTVFKKRIESRANKFRR